MQIEQRGDKPATSLETASTERFRARPLPAASMFPRTHYFEIDSEKAGARYAVWVTTPISYEKQPDRRFPAIYSPDGNRNAPLAASLCDLDAWDLMDSFQPTIQICVGYTNEDAGRALAVRARDLLPPAEALPPGLVDDMRNGIDNGVLDRVGIELYIHNLKNPAGDRFLAFLTEELHPFIVQNYRVEIDSLGLFGHSYGGLFATYAALQDKTIFRNFGASSPGILVERSAIFPLYADAAARGGLSERNLHMTVATREVTDPGMYQPMVAGGTVEFIRLAGATPIAGLTFSSRLFDDETHITVKPSAMHNFLRTFYLRPA